MLLTYWHRALVCVRTSKGEHVRSAAPTAVERQCSQQTPRAVQYINPTCSNTVLSLNLDLKPTSQLFLRIQETGWSRKLTVSIQKPVFLSSLAGQTEATSNLHVWITWRPRANSVESCNKRKLKFEVESVKSQPPKKQHLLTARGSKPQMADTHSP